jgi:hypothetical protein
MPRGTSGRDRASSPPRTLKEGDDAGGAEPWHVEHVKACCAFDLTRESEVAACFHFSNLQPL